MESLDRQQEKTALNLELSKELLELVRDFALHASPSVAAELWKELEPYGISKS